MGTQRILVIDDEEAILEVIQACLEELGDWEVLTGNSGTAGLQLAETEQPDGILLDLSMPGMDGFEVLQHLRSNPNTASIPVILLTARVQAEDQFRFSQLGVAGVILKPFDPMQVTDQVAAAFHWEGKN